MVRASTRTSGHDRFLAEEPADERRRGQRQHGQQQAAENHGYRRGVAGLVQRLAPVDQRRFEADVLEQGQRWRDHRHADQAKHRQCNQLGENQEGDEGQPAAHDCASATQNSPLATCRFSPPSPDGDEDWRYAKLRFAQIELGASFTISPQLSHQSPSSILAKQGLAPLHSAVVCATTMKSRLKRRSAPRQPGVELAGRPPRTWGIQPLDPQAGAAVHLLDRKPALGQHPLRVGQGEKADVQPVGRRVRHIWEAPRSGPPARANARCWAGAGSAALPAPARTISSNVLGSKRCSSCGRTTTSSAPSPKGGPASISHCCAAAPRPRQLDRGVRQVGHRHLRAAHLQHFGQPARSAVHLQLAHHLRRRAPPAARRWRSTRSPLSDGGHSSRRNPYAAQLSAMTSGR